MNRNVEETLDTFKSVGIGILKGLAIVIPIILVLPWWVKGIIMYIHWVLGK